MRILPKQIWKEEFNYYSDKSVDELKADIQQLLNKTRGWDFSVNLVGEFTSEFEFEMTPKWQFVMISNYERNVSYLNGQIYSDELKRTRVTFSVRPNSISLIFSFLFPIFGILFLTTINTRSDIEKNIIISLVFIFVVPAFMLSFGYFAKQQIKNRFVKTFSLKPIE